MRKTSWIMLLTTLACAAPAAGQLLGGGGGLGNAVGGLTNGLRGSPTAPASVVSDLSGPFTGLGNATQALSPADLLSQRRDRLRALIQDNRAVLDDDGAGNPIRRNEIVGIGISAEKIKILLVAGYTVSSHEAIDGLDLSIILLTPPKGESARKALIAIRKLDPAGHYTLDAIYEPARAPLAPSQSPVPRADVKAHGAKIGMIDGGVGAHPAFATASIEQRGFAGNPQASGHGTAVASLIVGNTNAFHGAATGSPLLVADVYCGSVSSGSALTIVKAMAWLATRNVQVITISLVGPPNPLLEAGVKALQAEGVAIVAAVGNDGPAAPPQYPASYPGVIAVTGVDAKGKALIEAGRPLHLDFAAPGADMVGAVPGGGWESLRGTSFAAPLVAARIASLGDVRLLAAEAQPGIGRVGKGIICGTCRTAPRIVGHK